MLETVLECLDYRQLLVVTIDFSRTYVASLVKLWLAVDGYRMSKAALLNFVGTLTLAEFEIPDG